MGRDGKNMASKGPTLNDSFSLSINFKWLLQIIAGTAIVVYAFWTIEGRIQSLERNMIVAMEEIELHDKERLITQKAHEEQLQEQVSVLQKELNINPFSWGRKKKK